jgi:DNA-damage-inducible protein J
VKARIEPSLKRETEMILDGPGISATEAIRMPLAQVRLQKGLPFEVRIPNAATLAAINELESGKGGRLRLCRSLRATNRITILPAALRYSNPTNNQQTQPATPNQQHPTSNTQPATPTQPHRAAKSENSPPKRRVIFSIASAASGLDLETDKMNPRFDSILPGQCA